MVLKSGGRHPVVTVAGKGPLLPFGGPGPWALPLRMTLESTLPRRWTATLARARERARASANDATRVLALLP